MKKLIYFFVFISAIETNAQVSRFPLSERVNVSVDYRLNFVTGKMSDAIGPIHQIGGNINVRPFKKLPLFFGIDGGIGHRRDYVKSFGMQGDSGSIQGTQSFFSGMKTFSLYGRLNLNRSSGNVVCYVDAKIGRAITSTSFGITTTDGTRTDTVVTSTAVYDDDGNYMGEEYTETYEQNLNITYSSNRELITSQSFYGYLGVGMKIKLCEFFKSYQGIFLHCSGGFYFGNNMTYAVKFHNPTVESPPSKIGNPIWVTDFHRFNSQQREHAIGYYYTSPFKMMQFKIGITISI